MNAPAPQPSPPARHVPERTCVACRRKGPQDSFLRVTRLDGTWQLRAGPRAGRGAYLCPSAGCWQEKRLRRTFGAQAPAVARTLLEHHALNPVHSNP